MTSWKGRLLRAALAGLAALLLLGACGKKLHWDLDDVGSVLPDLQFNLVNDQGKPVTAADYAGKVVVLSRHDRRPARWLQRGSSRRSGPDPWGDEHGGCTDHVVADPRERGG